jgi:hypothetical protein
MKILNCQLVSRSDISFVFNMYRNIKLGIRKLVKISSNFEPNMI